LHTLAPSFATLETPRYKARTTCPEVYEKKSIGASILSKRFQLINRNHLDSDWFLVTLGDLGCSPFFFVCPLRGASNSRHRLDTNRRSRKQRIDRVFRFMLRSQLRAWVTIDPSFVAQNSFLVKDKCMRRRGGSIFLAHQVDAVLSALQRSAAKCVLFMFNNFDPERLREVVGSERCAFGMPFIQVFLDPNGRLSAMIRAGGQKSKISQQLWVDVFSTADLPAVLEPNMLLWLRCHAPMCIAFESFSFAGVRRGSGASWGESMVLARGALIRALGYPIYPSGKSLMSDSPASGVAAMLWALSRIRSFRDLSATGAGECRALVDVLVAAAPRANPPLLAARIEAMKPTEKTL
jgi:2-dehydropantoate 2-reductase